MGKTIIFPLSDTPVVNLLETKWLEILKLLGYNHIFISSTRYVCILIMLLAGKNELHEQTYKQV